jgi:penicillin-binding protein 2
MLVTTIDATVQAAAEKQLKAAIMRARHTGTSTRASPSTRRTSGAVVVLDVRTGGIVAMASYPTYDPNIWVGGISSKDYKSIASKKNNYPNQSRAFQGEFAPGSTFKAISTPAAVRAGYTLTARTLAPRPTRSAGR